jgi:hypothetical protein
MTNNFWIEDIKTGNSLKLLDKYWSIIPMKEMTRNEQLNTITRLSIYLFIFFLLFANDLNWLYVPIFTVLIVITLYYIKDEKEEYTQECRKPKKDNPNMNYLMSDYFDDNKDLEACDINDEKIQEEVEENYNDGLYRNVGDLYDTHNSKRQFYTMPSTTLANDQETFAKWLYNDVNNCKKGGNCLKYEDIRYQ